MGAYYSTVKEEDLIKEASFDLSILAELKELISEEQNNLRTNLSARYAERLIGFFDNEIKPLMYYQKEFKREPLKGIEIEGFIIEKPEEFLDKINSKILDKGYIAFLTDSDTKPEYQDKVAIIQTTDKFDVLKLYPTPFPAYMNTKYSIDAKTLINQLKIWGKHYGVDIIGVGYNWIKLRFNKLPSDLVSIKNDIEKLKSEDSADDLIEDLKNSQLLELWWED